MCKIVFCDVYTQRQKTHCALKKKTKMTIYPSGRANQVRETTGMHHASQRRPQNSWPVPCMRTTSISPVLHKTLRDGDGIRRGEKQDSVPTLIFFLRIGWRRFAPLGNFTPLDSKMGEELMQLQRSPNVRIYKKPEKKPGKYGISSSPRRTTAKRELVCAI